MRTIPVILTLNTGSSSIKFSVFRYQNKIHKTPLLYGQVDKMLHAPNSQIYNETGKLLIRSTYTIEHSNTHEAILDTVLKQYWHELNTLLSAYHIVAIGHRVVHGADQFTHATLITAQVKAQLANYIPLANLHQPFNLAGIESAQLHYPDIPHIACFDTAFHHTQSVIAQAYALPKGLSRLPIKRYGFHGLSYDYISSVATDLIDQYDDTTRCVVAHLGHGASLCAIQGKRSVATTMGLTALAGLPMGSRCGSIDPGIILYLQQECGFSLAQITDLLYDKSGLLGVSEESSDMRELLASKSKNAKMAVDLFCYRTCCELGALVSALGGIDHIIFTAGIGEHCPSVRQQIITGLAWLGCQLDEKANIRSALAVHNQYSKVGIWVIPTNEEWVIAEQTVKLL